MTTTPRFTFEQEVVLSETEYVRVFGLTGRRAPLLRILAIALVGVVCIFSPYTMLLGIGLLLLTLTALAVPRLLPFGAGSIYRRSLHLHGPMTCGVSDAEMWVRGNSFRYSSGWSNLSVWRESHRWLVLSASGMAPVFLSVERLRDAQIYETVKELANLHGKRFGSRDRTAERSA